MIGCTKLLCGTATVSEALKYANAPGGEKSHLLQFSANNRPLVVWNTTNRCNLRCRHCYLEAEDRSYSDELSSNEAREFIQDLSVMGVPVLLFSGGEPLLRKDLIEMIEYASTLGLRPVLSSNGTLITPEKADALKKAGIQYIGVSIDGGPTIHDSFRCQPGSFNQAVEGIRNSLAAGIKTGIRFTVNHHNRADLEQVLDLVVKEGIPRFCMYHLVYSGRGRDMDAMDIDASEKRELMDWLMEKTIELHRRGVEVEILTTDNHADGIKILQKIEKSEPERAREVMQLLQMHGGCSAGTKFANVDPRGFVHPCQFWQHYSLGNVRERKFSEIWQDPKEPLLVKLREKSNWLKGRCGDCRYNPVCGGCRIRAEAVTGDMWNADPACYLTDQEIIGSIKE